MFLIFCFFLVSYIQYTTADCPTIIGTRDWDAAKPKYYKNLNVPVDLVVIQHTASQTCTDDVSCAKIVRELQKIHIEESKLWDIAVSFLVASHGKIYEGRGWTRVAVHTPGYNNQSYGIAFIGNFNNQEPTPAALEAAQTLIKCAVEKGRLTPNHKLVAHSQLLHTESPGQKLFSKIMTWLDWVNDVTDIKKKADKGEYKVEEEPDTSVLVWTNPKQIDTLSDERDVITNLINTMADEARATIKTIETFAIAINKAVNAFTESLSAGLKAFRDAIASAYRVGTRTPNAQKCAEPIKKQSVALYNDVETKAKKCADLKTKEVNDNIKSITALMDGVIAYTVTAAEYTQNCTELNYQIIEQTKDCIKTTTNEIRTNSKSYHTQKETLLSRISDQLKVLPTELQKCAEEPLAEAGLENAKYVKDIGLCALSVPKVKVPPIASPFGI